MLDLRVDNQRFLIYNSGRLPFLPVDEGWILAAIAHPVANLRAALLALLLRWVKGKSMPLAQGNDFADVSRID